MVFVGQQESHPASEYLFEVLLQHFQNVPFCEPDLAWKKCWKMASLKWLKVSSSDDLFSVSLSSALSCGTRKRCSDLWLLCINRQCCHAVYISLFRTVYCSAQVTFMFIVSAYKRTIHSGISVSFLSDVRDETLSICQQSHHRNLSHALGPGLCNYMLVLQHLFAVSMSIVCRLMTRVICSLHDLFIPISEHCVSVRGIGRISTFTNTKDVKYLQIFTYFKTGYEYCNLLFFHLLFSGITKPKWLYKTSYCLLLSCHGKLS